MKFELCDRRRFIRIHNVQKLAKPFDDDDSFTLRNTTGFLQLTAKYFVNLCRTVAYKNVQKKKYATKAADPDGSRHPVLRMYLIAVDKKNNAQVLRLSKHVNDSGRAGHDSSMGQTFMTIRRTLKTLTKEQVRRVFTPEVSL